MDIEKLKKRIVIMGMGNLLLKDEGVGVHIINALKEKNNLPEYVELIDAGTAALDVLQMLHDVDKLIVVDAVKGGSLPGAVYKFKPGDIRSANRKAKPSSTVYPNSGAWLLRKKQQSEANHKPKALVNEVSRAATSLHQLNFIEALSIVERFGKPPKDVTIIGIEPKEMAIGLELSPEIAGKIPKIIQLIREIIEQ